MLAFLAQFAATSSEVCKSPSFFGIPTWHKYLETKATVTAHNVTVCQVQVSFMKDGHLDLSSLLLVSFGIVDILLRVASLVAVGFIIYAGVQYVISQGESDKTKQALGTIINALVGLGITIVAAAGVSFLGHRLGPS